VQLPSGQWQSLVWHVIAARGVAAAEL
jgi:hypothetical protein